MHTRDLYVAAAISQSREAFAKQFAHLSLLLKLGQSPSDADEWRFQTRVSAARKMDGTPAMLSDDASMYWVSSLTKEAENPWPERISIGRARNSDVVLPDKSVRKLHCHDTWKATGGRLLTDTNSRNGTFVNDNRLAFNARHAIKVNDRLAFGSVQPTFITPS